MVRFDADSPIDTVLVSNAPGLAIAHVAGKTRNAGELTAMP